jgi:co-chaperonin GroES (HSP10)
MVDITDLGPMDVPKTSEEITDMDIPDPDPLPEIAGSHVLVRPVKTNTEKVGNIYIPDNTRGDIKYLHNVGRVLAFGPRAYKTKEGTEIDWVPGGLKIGDTVQWERFVGQRFRYKGVNLVLLKDVAIQMRVGESTDLDPMTTIES